MSVCVVILFISPFPPTCLLLNIFSYGITKCFGPEPQIQKGPSFRKRVYACAYF